MGSGTLTDAGEILALDLLNGGAQSITTPIKLALLTANGSDAAAGTEVTGGSYSRQTITFTAGSAGNPVSNSGAISIAGMPACTVVGWELWDSSATPKRIWHDAWTASQTYAAGNTATVAVGALTLGLD